MEGYVPKGERKKILLLCDDIRTHSGIGTIAKEIVAHTAHRYNYTQLGAAINHPEAGKRMDVSDSLNQELNLILVIKQVLMMLLVDFLIILF